MTETTGLTSVDLLMPVNPLPPQAYTKETLQRAYAWLLTQNESVKGIAQDQNILVSLYLKAQRNGEASLEAPSIQNFKQELKSLANMIGEFQPMPSMTQSAPQPIQQTQQQVQKAIPATDLNFDTETLKALNLVRETLNLSSEQEALRALVALGLRQFKKLSQ